MLAAITFLFCFLTARFFYVQVAWSGELGYRALDQWMREIPVVAERGLITDRNGVVLAENDTSYTVFARSNAVSDKEGTSRLLDLNKKEFELLRYCMRNADIVLTRDVLLTEIWGYVDTETRTLDNHIARLRKLGIDNFETVFGVGYRFKKS